MDLESLANYQVTYPPKVFLLISCVEKGTLGTFPNDRKEIYFSALLDFIDIAQHHYDTEQPPSNKPKMLELLEGLQELKKLLIQIWKINLPTKELMNKKSGVLVA
jgi:hypothetical protein